MIRRHLQINITPELLRLHNDAQNEFHKNDETIRTMVGAPWSEIKLKLKFSVYEKWADFIRSNLIDVFGRKCAYCEDSLENQDVHIEHFRPKKEVDLKDCVHGIGYWWLGAQLENLLPSCIHCNRSPGQDYETNTSYGSGKGNRFPLLPNSPRASEPGDEILESPVLINPLDDEPSNFFTYKFIDGNSFATLNYPLGFNDQLRATGSIEIYGLNRYGLSRKRIGHLHNVKKSLNPFIKSAISLNEAQKNNKHDEINKFQDEMKINWDDLYEECLSSHKQPFMYPTLRYVERRLQEIGLSLSDLIGDCDFYIPHNSIT